LRLREVGEDVRDQRWRLVGDPGNLQVADLAQRGALDQLEQPGLGQLLAIGLPRVGELRMRFHRTSKLDHGAVACRNRH
jgi:hypothetical protein